MPRPKDAWIKKFAGLIAALAATFQRDADEALFAGYEMGLDDLPIEAIEAAVRRAMRTCKHLPTASELRALAGDVPPEQRAVLVWDAVERAMRDLGPYKTVSFDDPAINASVRNLGGWPWLCDLGTGERKAARKDFERVYVAYCQAGVSSEQAAPLLGITDQENGGSGYGTGNGFLVRTGLIENTRLRIRKVEPRQVSRTGEVRQIMQKAE